MKRKTPVVLAAFAVTALIVVGVMSLASGCDRGGKTLKLAFVTNNSSEFWKIASNGVHKYEREAKVTVDIKMPPSGKTEEQNQILENLINQGYDGIAVSVIAPKDQIPVLDKVASKAKLITFDSDAPDSKRLLYVGSLNYDAGKMLGEQIVKLLPEGGKIAIFVGTFSADNAAQRLKGIEDAIKGHNIEIAEKREDLTDRVKARKNVEDIVNNTALDVKLVCGLWSYNGPAIAAALEGTGKKGKVLAAVFDDEDDTVRGIESGTITCTCVQHPFEMGYRAAKWIHQLASDPTKAMTAIPPDKIDNTGLEIVDKSNLPDFEKRRAEWKK